MPLLPALLAVLLLLVPAYGHDSWISRGGHKNTAGEWCCGDGDCALIDADTDDVPTVKITAAGYEVHGMGTIFGASAAGNVRMRIDEIVPFSEAQPSPDGAFWRCKRPDGTRRCFFAPPPSM